MTEKLLTAKEVADFLQIGERTVMNLARVKTLAGMKIAGKWRFAQSEVEAYVKKQQQEGSTIV